MLLKSLLAPWELPLSFTWCSTTRPYVQENCWSWISLTEARDGVSEKRFFGTETSHMGSSKLLIALDRMDTECRWSTVTWVSTFEMGLIHTSFQTCGKYSFEIQLWMIAVRRPTRCSAESFTNWATGWLTPIKQSIHSCLTHPTTGLFTILKIIPEILVCLLMEHDFSSLWWKIPGRKRIYEKVIPFFC